MGVPKDPCGFFCFLVTYSAIVYADYCIIIEVLLPTLIDRYQFCTLSWRCLMELLSPNQSLSCCRVRSVRKLEDVFKVFDLFSSFLNVTRCYRTSFILIFSWKSARNNFMYLFQFMGNISRCCIQYIHLPDGVITYQGFFQRPW